MGMDLDYLAAKQALESIENILDDIDWGEREKIADDIEKFEEMIVKKYT